MLQKLHLIAPPFFLAALIFWLSSGPITPPPLGPEFSDKILHVIAFAGLAFWVGRWFFAAGGAPIRCAVGVAVLISGLYGVCDEVHQVFVPGRLPDVVDAWADLLGAVCGAPLGAWAVIVWRQKTAGVD